MKPTARVAPARSTVQTSPGIHFQGHCSLNGRAAPERGANEPRRFAPRVSAGEGHKRRRLPSWRFCRRSRCTGWFLSLAARRAAFSRGAVSGEAEKRGSGEPSSQLTSARENQPGAAVVIGVALPNALMCSSRHTAYMLVYYSWMSLSFTLRTPRCCSSPAKRKYILRRLKTSQTNITNQKWFAICHHHHHHLPWSNDNRLPIQILAFDELHIRGFGLLMLFKSLCQRQSWALLF